MCHYKPNNSTIECLSTEKRTDRAKEKANDAQMNAVAKKSSDSNKDVTD